MRSIAAAALCLALSSGNAAIAAQPAASPAGAGMPAGQAAVSTAAADEAAARHAKRIACRKQAAEKKLINASKFDFIKQCMAKP